MSIQTWFYTCLSLDLWRNLGKGDQLISWAWCYLILAYYLHVKSTILHDNSSDWSLSMRTKRPQFPDLDFLYYSTLLQDVSYFCSRSSFEEYLRCEFFVWFDYGILTLDQTCLDQFEDSNLIFSAQRRAALKSKFFNSEISLSRFRFHSSFNLAPAFRILCV